MQNYLLLVKNQIQSHSCDSSIKDYFIKEISLYQKYWQKYSNDLSDNPLNKAKDGKCDLHYFDFPTNEQITISWNIDSIYQYAIANKIPIRNLQLNEFESLLRDDIIATEEELNVIHAYVDSVYEHQYTPILIMNFKPMNQHIILDGRHRYVEYKKLNPTAKIPIYVVDDDNCIEHINLKNQLVAYIIVHNIKIIADYLMGSNDYSKIISLTKIFS